MKKLIFCIITLITALVSCSDNDDPKVEYETSVSVTAAHIFDNYVPLQAGDFNMQEDGWKLNIQVLIYDENGKLMEKAEKSCGSLLETLDYTPSMSSGKYTIVSIADFRDGLGGEGYKFWNIENVSDLQYLSITENETYFPVPFETLGIDIKSMDIKDMNQSLNVDIKPVTSLVNVYMNDKDYSGWGINGYSRFSALTEGYFIKSAKTKNKVQFENGALVYSCSEQQSNYNLAISNVYEKKSEQKNPIGFIYRALLPEENKTFNFHIQKRNLSQEDYNTFLVYSGEFDTDGISNTLPEIASNKQYVVNMVLDAMSLVATEYTSDFIYETNTQQIINEHIYQLISNMVNTNYVNLLGQNENYVKTFLNNTPYDYDLSKLPYISYYPRSKADHFEQFVTVAYLNTDLTKCNMVQLLLPDLTNEIFDYIKELLSSKFKIENVDYGADVFTFLEPGKADDDSKYRIVLQRRYNSTTGKYIYFLDYILRSKYY